MVFVDRLANDLERERVANKDGQPISGGRNIDAGKGIQPVAAVAQKLCHPGSLLESLPVERYFERQHVMWAETRFHGMQSKEGADEKHRADQQYQRERNLADDQHRAHPALAKAAAGAAATFLQDRVQISA